MNLRLRDKILNHVRDADEQWHMNLFNRTEPFLLGLSGGKDSLALLKLMAEEDLPFVAVHIDQKLCDSTDFIEWSRTLGVEVISLPYEADLTRKNACFSCSRGRRHRLLEAAESRGIRDLILAHHRDDANETLLLNLFFSREISTMTPVQNLFSGKFRILRPLYRCPEVLLSRYAEQQSLPVCKNLCPQDLSSHRKEIKDLIRDFQQKHSRIDVGDNLFAALNSVKNNFLP